MDLFEVKAGLAWLIVLGWQQEGVLLFVTLYLLVILIDKLSEYEFGENFGFVAKQRNFEGRFCQSL